MIKKITLSFIATISLLQAQTLEHTVSKVLETNPVVLERLHNYRETAQDLSIARSEFLPTIDLVSSVGNEKTNSESFEAFTGESLDYYENSLTVMLNIFDGFGTLNKIDYQKSRIIAAAYNFIEKANDAAFESTRRYIEVIKQRELLETARESVTINEEIYLKVKDLFSSGIATKSEMRKIESSLFLARSNYIAQENNTIDSVFSFKKIYGENINMDSLVVPSFQAMLPRTLQEATAYTMRNNPSILVSNYNIKAAQNLKKQREKNFYPKVDLIAQQNLDKNTYGLEDERNRFRAGVMLTYNFYRGGADLHTSQKSISSIYRNVQTKNELQRQTIEGLELSWSANSILDRQLVELKRYKDSSEETLNLYIEEYDLGKRTLLDLLAAQNDLINSKSQIVTATYDQLFAKFRILDAMGLLVPAVMGNEYGYMQKVGLVGLDAVDNEDTLPISFDEDGDNIAILNDICQASSKDGNILSNGCENYSKKYSKVQHFDLIQFDRSELSVDSISLLNKVVSTVRDNNNSLAKVLITGHTSKSSDTKDDLEISLKYAQTTQKALIDAGISPKMMKTYSEGSESPISSDESLNDRVNVIMYLK